MKEMQMYWEKIYGDENKSVFSWNQDFPKISFEWIEALELDKHAPIIDIGGGDSKLAEILLDHGYTDITVLDISENVLQRNIQRMGDKAEKIKWILSDILEFSPTQKYAVWHDRAAFHFLRKKEQINRYRDLAENAVVENGHIIIGTFSHAGPDKCSGLEVHKYNAEELTALFENKFNRMAALQSDHLTPAGAVQNFVFCHLQKRNGDKVEHSPIPEIQFVQDQFEGDMISVCDPDKGSCCC